MDDIHDKLRWFREVIRDVRVAMVTTLGDDGAPHARPLATLRVDDRSASTTLWFFARKSGAQTSDIARSPHISLSYVAPAGFVTATATAEIDADAARAKDLWDEAYRHWFPGGLGDPDLLLIKVSVEKVEFWDSPLNPVARLVEFVRAAESEIRVAAAPASIDADATLPPADAAVGSHR